MENRLNKPKVFLSHAWENKPFIERIANDLRRCQIDYWLDSEEIRDGRSWLKMIFEDGIPTCDAVIVYLTEESIRSKMVERELDAAVVHQLAEGRVTLLPYVSVAELRGQLRSDIQTLQCREWNENNYDSILPTVVGELWRSYLERTIETAVLQEKSRRLEQELENKRLKDRYEISVRVFSPAEEKEFQHLKEQLSRHVEITFGLFKKNEGENTRTSLGTEICKLSLLRIVLAIIHAGGVYFDRHYLGFYLLKTLGETVQVQDEEVGRNAMGGRTIDEKVVGRIQTELNTYGLTTITRVERFNRKEVAYEFAEKMYRFKYWLEYNKLVVNEPLKHIITLTPVKAPASAEKVKKKDRGTEEAFALDKRISQVRRRRTWKTNGEGTSAASKEVQAIFADLNQRVNKSNEILENIKLDFNSDLNACNVSADEISLTVNWNCPSQNASDCSLLVKVKALTPGSQLIQNVYSTEFTLDVDNDLTILWRMKEAVHSDPFSTSKIADLCWRNFIQAIQQNEEGAL